jgi:cell wall-associated NlpC family hydrolase
MRHFRVVIRILGLFMTIIMIFSNSLEAVRGVSLLERIDSALHADPAFTDEERTQYLDAFRQKLAAYGRDILKGGRERGAEVLLSILVEGSFDRAPVERTVDIASSAYIAVRRGSDPVVVEGIALYGFRKRIDADRIEAWANGYGSLVGFGVPTQVAEDLVFQTAGNEWNLYTFNTFKWGLVEAVKAGYPPEDFQAYMVGTYLKGGERPGSMVSRSLRYFGSLGGGEPDLPAYKASFIPKANPARQAEKDAPEGTGASADTPAKKSAPGGQSAEPHAKADGQSPDHPSQTRQREGPSSPVLGYLLRIEGAYKRYLGVPYAWGGTTKQGMDCSGFVQRVFFDAGISLPRSSGEQWETGAPVARYALREGDLVFFITVGKRISHVGIVTRPAEDEFIHASSSKGVSYALLSWRYFDKRYAGARRVVPTGLAGLDGGSVHRPSRLFVEMR